MNRLLAFVLLGLLTGCIAVADYGAAWQQAKLDPTLNGTWRKIVDLGAPPDDQQLVIFEQDGAHDVIPYQDGAIAEDFSSVYPVMSLTIGSYTFLASRNRGLGGEMVRYRLHGDQLEFLVLQPPAARAWLAQEDQNSPLNLSDYTAQVTRLDAAAQATLGRLPDNDSLWKVTARYRKIKQP